MALDRLLTLIDNWLADKKPRERLMLYLLLGFTVWAFVFSPMDAFFTKRIEQLMLQTPNKTLEGELKALGQAEIVKEEEIKNLILYSKKISADLATVKAKIENTPELYLGHATVTGFTDLSLKTIQKYNSTLISLTPSKIKPESSGSLLSCTIDMKFRANLKNSMHILNELENSKYSPHIRSFAISDKNDEVSVRVVLYGISR